MFSSQLIEQFIALMKFYQRRKGKMSKHWLLRLWNFLDLYCVGSILYNQVDFTAKEKQLAKASKINIYSNLNEDIIKQMPQYLLNFYNNYILQIKVTPPYIPTIITNNITAPVYQNQFHQISVEYENVSLYVENVPNEEFEY